MAAMLEVIAQDFERRGVKYQQLGQEAVQAGFQLENGSYMAFLHPDEEHQRLVVIVTMSTSVPQDSRAAVAEFITRANLRFAVGNLNLDFDDGQVMFRAGTVLGDGKLNGELTWRILGLALTSMDFHCPGIMKVIYSKTPPSEALDSLMSSVPDPNPGSSGTSYV